jgi:hypothetical protein
VLGGVALLRQLESVAGADWTVLAFISVLSLLSIFCLVVGYRLAFNRPNRYGSMLPPTAWAFLAGIFAIAGLGSAATTFAAKGSLRGALPGGVSALMLGALCWRKRVAMINRTG